MKHRILSSVVELTLSDESRLEEVRRIISEVHAEEVQRGLGPILDGLSSEEEVLALDSVVIDVGAVASKDLAESLRRGLRERLGRGLADAVRRNGVRRTHPETEVLASYLRGGRLPWWVEEGGGDPVRGALLRLVQRSDPGELREIARLVRDRRAARRLAAHLAGSHEGLVGLLAGWSPTLPRTALDAIPHILEETLGRRPEVEDPRVDVVEALLLAAVGASGGTIEGLVRHALALLEQHLDLPLGIGVLPENADSSTERRTDLVAGVLSSLGPTQGVPPASLVPTGEAERSDRGALAPWLRAWTPWLASLPAPSRSAVVEAWRSHIEAAVDHPGSVEEVPPPLGTAGVLRNVWRRWQRESSDLRADLAVFLEVLGAAAEEAVAVTAGTRWMDTEDGGLDPVRVGSSGLVLLRPFLVRYFDRLGFLAAGSWRGPWECHRAARLLHALARADEPGDHELELERALVGLPPGALVEARNPLAEHESMESKILLSAIGEHVTAFGAFSTEELRRRFLHREGWLRATPAAWELRVERAPHDAPLDALPWSFGTVSFPWMQVPLRVEW